LDLSGCVSDLSTLSLSLAYMESSTSTKLYGKNLLLEPGFPSFFLLFRKHIDITIQCTDTLVNEFDVSLIYLPPVRTSLLYAFLRTPNNNVKVYKFGSF
jgi:hypothetical protein